MSEEILRSLAQLFAIITKQDGGVIPIEREFVYNYFRKKLNLATAEEYIALYEDFLKDGESKEEKPEEGKEVKKKLTSVKDSVRTLGICRKINKTLTLKQKIVVLVELLEILILEGKSIEQKQEIIDTVATAFNIEKEEYKILHTFIAEGDSAILNHPEIIAINATPPEQYGFAAKHLSSEYLNGNVFFARIVSVDMIFMT